MSLLNGIKTVRTKILGGYLVVAAAALLVGFLAVTRMSVMHDRTDSIYSENLKGMEAVGSTATAFDRLVAATLTHGIENDPAAMDQAEREVVAAERIVREGVDEYVGFHDGETPETLARFEEDLARYLDQARNVAFPLSRANDLDGFRRVRAEQLGPITAEATASLDELMAVETAEADEAFASATDTFGSGRLLTFAATGAATALAVVLGLAVATVIGGPLRRSTEALDRVADGDLTVRLDIAQADEIGRLATALNRMIDRMAATIRAITESSSRLASASEELSAVSQELSANAEEASAQAGSVSVASEQVSANVQTVASGTEQMGASISEISGNATQAASIASTAGLIAGETESTVTKLGESSAEIGEVVAVITSIAEQTNLLALNATIEAARAGEAGKGFAVVANEVKELAKETAKATGDIGHRIAAIQGDASAVSGAISQITSVIGEIADFQSTIASAVEEQSVTTSEISRNVAEAATCSSEIAGNISHVAVASQQTSEGASNLLTASGDLAHQADELNGLVAQFKV